VVAPIIMEMVRPQSVVDVGCGRGSWLVAFQELGVPDVLGFDGLTEESSLLRPDHFQQVDLREPLVISREFDLALCLEVAEHLPSRSANRLVEQLTTLAPVVLFSAAIPGQGGPGHVNERWPDYWAKKFRRHGYSEFDLVRPLIDGVDDVAWWYQQNLLLFSKASQLNGHESTGRPTRLVHPALREGRQIRLQDRIRRAGLRFAVR
jgi:SAM-dependent methyltransferase